MPGDLVRFVGCNTHHHEQELLLATLACCG